MTEEMYQMLHRMLCERAAHYDDRAEDSRDVSGRVTDHEATAAWMAYSSARDMLEYAHDGNFECLSQFDYFGK